MRIFGLIVSLLFASISYSDAAEEKAASAPHPGYRFLTEKSYLPPDFDQATFDEVWKVWPGPLRDTAAKASSEERRQMAFERHGLSERRGDESGKPLQYVVDDRGNWSMNCLACHGGKLLDQSVPGMPNTHYALETLTAEIRLTKLKTGRKLSRMDVGSLFMPLGGSNGTTNAVMFGVVLMGYRDAKLNVYPHRSAPKMVHHDMDAPPWWYFYKRKRLYIDGFAKKSPRSLMQFMLVKDNGPEKFRAWEEDFQAVYRWMESLRPPRYPFEIDRKLAARGRVIFEDNCSRCHGTYGEEWTYPNKITPIAEVGTDPVRLQALTPEHRKKYGASWFAHFGEHRVIADPGGYVAPPLDGIWASGPYLHNGSVPTLWHLFHPDERPTVWRRTEGYDRERIGLEFKAVDSVPKDATFAQQRTYFDTRRFGKSARGHTFPADLSADQKRAVLEYLKTL